MSVLVVVQARMGSTRLPGKVLQPLAGRPMLELQLARLLAAGEPEWTIVVATSTAAIDDPIAALTAHVGLDVVRGSEADVLARFVDALDAHPASVVVRLTGDCPLTDPAIVHDAIALHIASGAAYTSNVFPRSFPTGLDVEVVDAQSLRHAAAHATDPLEREHVTPYLVRRPEQFALATLFSGDDLGEEWWTVDRPEDLQRLRWMVDQLDDPARDGWRDILAKVGRTANEPGTIHLRPLPPPPPGSCPWVRSWIVERDGHSIGDARVSVGHGQTDVVIDATGVEPEVRRALDQLLAGDVQVSRADPN